MSAASRVLQRRLTVPGILLIAGLLVQVVTLYWTNPTAFIAFAVVGVGLVGLGILMTLHALVRRR